MEYHFKITVKPFSINNYYYRDKRHKTSDARAWELLIHTALEEHKQLLEMADKWRMSRRSYFTMEMEAFYPLDVFYTQQGEISGRTIDQTNWEKPLQDMIFNKMGLNDKLVKRLVSEKSPGTHYYIDVTIRLEEGK